jgi:hypothetical protein
MNPRSVRLETLIEGPLTREHTTLSHTHGVGGWPS